MLVPGVEEPLIAIADLVAKLAPDRRNDLPGLMKRGNVPMRWDAICGRNDMSKLRHIAITVNDLEESARFYESVFQIKRHTGNDVAISMSDGVVNLTLLKVGLDEQAHDERGKDFVGLHHIGFVVDDVVATGEKIEEHGGSFHRAPTIKMAAEIKYRDPNGVVFDISNPDHAWAGIS